MAIIVDEDKGTISFTECTVTFPYGFSVSSGVGTIVITPAGGVASFPLAIQGASGLPPNITMAFHVIGPDDPLPDPNPEMTVIDEGGPGEAAHYHYDCYVQKGDKGDAASFNFLDADDLEDGEDLAEGDVGTNGYVLSYAYEGTGTPGIRFIPQKTGDIRGPSAIAATSWSNTAIRLLCAVTLEAKPFPRKVLPTGSVVVTGSADTRVDLVAYLGDPDDGGVEIGRAFGQAGAAPPPLVMAGGPPATTAGGNANYAIVPAGQSATVYFRAEQKASSSNNWATAGAPDGARAGVVVVAV
ncbi:minor tail protein [Mycobacterium phage Mangethe]|uniref:Minor tail protein n=1 Tax=Mycobacterium phage Majeke TaxID=2024296 RepID=A0A249XTH5_9CAUD|nr:minor tail protein [Mycobacterium phage Majeke]ASZ75280.1 minor tail protein [Mycobacterium phage Majeke]AYQ99853.1 minor tail protein [Mycobacterium phage Mangethe]